MPLEFDSRHFIPEQVKQCKKKLREKEERIVSLETENAILHLKLAQLQTEIEKERNYSSCMEASLSTAKQRDSMKSDDLGGILKQIKEAKDDLRSLRSAMVTMPTRVTQSVEDWALSEAERLKQSLYTESVDFNLLQRRVCTFQSELTSAQDKYMREKRRRRELHNTLVELRGNIRVHCRVRPVLEYDYSGTQTASSRHLDSPEEVVHVDDDETVNVNCNRPGHSQTSRQFEFERVYNQSESQDEVFNEVKPLLTSLLDGYNVCIMAYGQTGSGKTHTMLGGRYTQGLTQTRTILDESEEDGVVPRAARELFRLLREKPNTHTVEVSVVEVYNNEIRDLLTLNPATSRHDIFTGDDGSMEVTSLTQRAVTTAVEIVDLVRHGMTYRHEDATQVHAHSSRSHLVVTLTVTLIQSPSHKPSTRARSQSPSRSSSLRDEHEVIRTKLQLVDLAGSECVGMSGVTGSALRETSHINRSLSALADVLGALAEGRGHVPYRNSRLTHLMKDSIGGDAKLLVVCCVSPTHRFLTETLQCLGFGSRARQIQRGPIKKRHVATHAGAGDQSPAIGARGRQGQRHSIPGEMAFQL
ncbi:kinesin-like protein KIF25 [Strongylocentrotus purpuratus]|uniref:Kinesin motor domain-containing protein n=1 Tax=Strongylocentrotus purpuratus TaxID=7668 RepID=A0A7M7T2X2_STRPU|nr:kinesin-like protein KIF25 [Strongylocentrotus purpuratus]